MLLHLFASAALLGLSTHAPADKGKLPWFEGSYEELLKEAEKQDRLIFLDFWADW